MADKRISQLTDRGTIANSDVVPIVVSGAVTTNKATISSIQTFMQGNLDLGVTSVGITLGSSGTDVSVSGSPITSSGNITINLPTASATNRGALSSADWSTFNSKQGAITLTTTGTSGASTLVGNTLNIPNYTTDLSGYVTLGTAQTITAQKTFTTSGSSDTMIISHGSGSGFALDVIKAGSGEAIRVNKTSGSGNAMTVIGGNFEAPTIVKTGGTSSQFLKADGSVDSNTYLTTGTAASTYVTLATPSTITGIKTFANNILSNEFFYIREQNASTVLANYTQIYANSTFFGFNNGAGTGSAVFTYNGSRNYTLPSASGTLALTSDLGSYVPYSGATSNVDLGSFVLSANNLTANGGSNAGRLELKHASNASLIKTGYFVLSPSSNNTTIHFGFSTGASTWKNFSFSSHLIPDNTITIFSLPSAGGTLAVTSDLGAYLPLSGGTLTGALNGTSGAFTGQVRAGNTSFGALNGFVLDYSANAASRSWRLANDLNSYGDFQIQQSTTQTGTTYANVLGFSSTGAATFLSSASARGLVVDGANNANISQLALTRTDSSWGIFNSTDLQFVNSLSNTTTPTNLRFVITAGGNVGIGTAVGVAPSQKLQVSGNTGTITLIKDTGSFAGLIIDAISTPFSRYSTNGTGKFELGYFNNNFYFNNNIGVDDFNAALKIASTGAATFSSSVTAGGAFNGGTLNINTSTGSERINLNGAIGFQNSSGVQKFHVFYSTGSGGLNFTETGVADNRLFLRDGGNVGIGTASPDYRLTVLTPTSDSTVGFNLRAFSTGADGDRTVISRYTSSNDGNWANSIYRAWAHIYETNGSERMRITSDGYTRLSANSGGIQFNGDTAAANALDDYEEGTWTPTFLGGTTNPTVSYAVRTGSYTKIGRQVTCNFEIGTTSNSGGAGNIRISGLPFTVGVRSYMAVATYNIDNTATTPISIFAEIGASGTEMLLLQTADNATWANIPWSQATNSVIYVNATITYFV